MFIIDKDIAGDVTSSCSNKLISSPDFLQLLPDARLSGALGAKTHLSLLPLPAPTVSSTLARPVPLKTGAAFAPELLGPTSPPRILRRLPARVAPLPGPVDVPCCVVAREEQQDRTQEQEGAERKATRAPRLFGLRRPFRLGSVASGSVAQDWQEGARGGRTSSKTVSCRSFNSSIEPVETHLCGSEQVRDPDTVPQNAEGALGVALDNVVIDTVKQGDHRIICEGTLNLGGKSMY